jgi:hypothetical protein
MSDLGISDVLAHPLTKYRNHLEYSGYHIDEEDEVLLCRHPRKSNLILRQIPHRGVLVSTFYAFESSIRRVEILEYVNQLNSEFLFLKAYLDEDNDDDERSLIMETFFEGEYDRSNFSLLLENLEYDISVFSQNMLTPEFLQ